MSKKPELKGDRKNNGKVQLSLVPLSGVEAYARAGAFGCEKYARDNWRGGLPINQLIDSLLRHAFKLADPGESDIDEESGLNHCDHIVWNAMTIAHAIKNNWPKNHDQ